MEVRVIKSQSPTEMYEDMFGYSKVEKSDKSEQIDPEITSTAGEWINHPVDMRGLSYLVKQSTILPQCINAYKNNIAGFGIAVRYINDVDETDEMKTEWDALTRILDLLSLEMPTKEVFQKLIEARETYGIAYLECIRNMDGQLAEIHFIKDTASVEMTIPQDPYVDVAYSYHGEEIQRKKRFRKFRQNIAGRTVYFKEFGDPRIMDKRSGEYVDSLELDLQANEMLDFPIGEGYYGLVRWSGCALTVDGCYRAEKLNNNYFRNGRHTPLMLILRGGTLSDESYTKLQEYMDDVKGENGQHAFLIVETETNKTVAGFEESAQPNVEVKTLAEILQTDGLFQEYQDNGRKKVQSAFMLPDIYVGYTQDFNRATSQEAIENTEKQVFQPERASLAWIINNKLLNGYGFKYVEAYFEEPDITNPDDLQKILTIAERAGGMTLNDARDLALDAMGKDAEEYPDSFNMEEIGNVPLALIRTMPALANFGYSGLGNQNSIYDLFGLKSSPTVNYGANSGASEEGQKDDGQPSEESKEADMNLDGDGGSSTKQQLDTQIEKAMMNKDEEVVAIMKQVRKMLVRLEGGEADETNKADPEE